MAVTKVELGGLWPEETSISTAIAAPRIAAAPASLLAGWSWRADSAERRARYQRLAQPLAARLDRAVENFAEALDQIRWPADAASTQAERDETTRGLAAAVESYNGLSTLLARNADLLDRDLPAGFRDPVEDQAPALAGLGLTRHADQTLSLDTSTFAQVLAGDPARVRTLLADASTGLLAQWSAAAAAARNGGVAKSLLPPTLLADLGPPAATELRLEEAGRLLDVLEATAATTAAGLADSLPLEGPARLFSREG